MARVVVIVIIVGLLPFICCDNPALKLIDDLNNFFNFDHNLFLLESSVNIDNFISSTSQKPRTIYDFENISDNTTEWNPLTEISSKNTFTIVALNNSSFDRNFEFFKKLKKIQRLQINMKIGIFLPQPVSMDDLRELFEWCKENLIVNIFAAIGGKTNEEVLNVFTFHPFGPFDVLNVTTSKSYENYFPSLQSNFQQQKLLAYDPSPTSIPKLAYRIWSVVFRMMNGSYIVDERKYSKHNHMTLRLSTQVNIRLLNAYPILVSTLDVVVPEALPYSDFSAFLRIVASEKFFAFSLATIAGVIFILTVCRYIKESKILFFQSAADVLNLLMMDNAYIRYQQLSRAEVLIICPLTFVGFFVVSGILSNLQSYLTRPVLQPQIETLEDIHSSPFPILTHSESWKATLIEALESRTRHQDWSDKIIAMDWKQFSDVVGMFNTSVSFFENDQTLRVRLRVQKRLNIKGYYNPKLKISKYFLSYRLFDKFLFFDRFNDIVHRTKSAGLTNRWLQRDLNRFGSEMLKLHLNCTSRSKRCAGK